jgi:hypothetical protein
VVVGVEPLGHLERRLVALAAGQREVARQGERARAGRARGAGGLLRDEVPEPFGYRAQQRDDVEHLVVEGERAGDGAAVGGQTQAGEVARGGQPQVAGGGLQLVGGGAAGPEGLDGALELASSADARVAQDRGVGKVRVRELDCHAYQLHRTWR